MKLTKRQKEFYLKGHSNECPYCHCTMIEGQGFEVSDNYVWQTIECQDCSNQWADIYKLIDVQGREG